MTSIRLLSRRCRPALVTAGFAASGVVSHDVIGVGGIFEFGVRAVFGSCVFARFGARVYTMLAAGVDGIMLDAHPPFLLAEII